MFVGKVGWCQFSRLLQLCCGEGSCPVMARIMNWSSYEMLLIDPPQKCYVMLWDVELGLVFVVEVTRRLIFGCRIFGFPYLNLSLSYLYHYVIIWTYHIMLLFDISIIGPLHALVSLCSGVMWVFILFLAAALKNAHYDFLLIEALSSTQVFLWILKTLSLSRFLLFANSVFINVEASLQCALGGNFRGSTYGLFKAG